MIKPSGFNGRVVLVGFALLCACGGETEAKPVPSKVEPSAVEPAKVAKPKVIEPSAPTDGVGVEAFCPEICRRSVVLGCRLADRCDVMCRNAFADLVCPRQLKRAMECALSLPVNEWFCSPDGIAAVKDGPCDDEQEAYDVCLRAIK